MMSCLNDFCLKKLLTFSRNRVMYETCVCNKVVCELQAFCDVTLCVLVTGHRHFKYSRSLAFRVKHSKKSEDKLDYDISKRP